MKILIVNTLYHPHVLGGAERSVQFLAEALAHAGHKPVVVSASSNRGVQVNEVNGVKVYYVGIKNLYWPFHRKQTPIFFKPLWHFVDTYNPLMAKEVDKVLAVEKPDAVHTNNLSCFSVAIWRTVKARKLPLVHTIRDYYLLCPKSSMFSRGRNCDKQCTVCRWYSFPRRKYSEFVDVVVGNSRFILNKHISLGLFPLAQAEVIFNAYEYIYELQSSGTARRYVRFGYIGRLHPAKGVEVVLKAVRSLPEGTWTLSIAGQGSSVYERYLRENSFRSIQFLGFVRPEEFFSQVDVLIVPSLWHEPLSRTVFEAYAHGIPVIGSRRGGTPELIEEGKTGFLFEPEQPETLVRVMVAFLENPELSGTMRRYCLAKALEFKSEKIVDKYEQVYRNAVSLALACKGEPKSLLHNLP